MLDRREPVDIHPLGQNDDAARMLAGRPPDADAARAEPFQLAGPFADALLLEVMHRETVGGLVRDRADRAGLEGLALAEDDLGVGLGHALLIA